MKVKYLLGSLLGGMLLAACTADDGLDNLGVQPADLSAPTFTVHFDESDPETRVHMNGTSGTTVTFDRGDLLSLFHGVSSSVYQAGAYELLNYENAIYKSDDTEADGALKFTTQAMVKAGGAIMVWPADTTFKNTGSANPVLTIAKDQNRSTWLLTPYISEVMTIEPWRDFNGNSGQGTGYIPNKETTAGYARNYDLWLKRVGATLQLAIDPKNVKNVAGVPVLDIRKVELTSENTAPFTTAISVVSSPLASTAYVAPSNNNPGKHPTWKNRSVVDQLNATSVATVTTTHIDNNVATFTLLPVKTGEENFASAYVRVRTNYGYKVYQSGVYGTTAVPAANQLWINGTNKTAVADGLKAVLTGMYTNASNGTTFAGEPVGKNGARTLTADLSKPIMNGLHIENEQRLKEVLAVYKANNVAANEAITNLILDGTNGVFEMHKETWDAVIAQLYANGNKLRLSPCTHNERNEQCTTIKLINDSDEYIEVPALRFGAENIGEVGKAANTEDATYKDWTDDIHYTWAGTKVTLVGKWSFDGDKGNKLTNPNRRRFYGFNKLEVSNGAELILNHEVKSEDDVTIDVLSGGKVYVKEEQTARVGVPVINESNGEINIEKDASLIMNNTKTLTNKTGGAATAVGGKINNAGWFGIESGSYAVIENFGTIYLTDANARLYITRNAVTGHDFKQPYAAGWNYIGSIVLFDKNAAASNVVVDEGANQGFIKLYVNKAGAVSGQTDFGVRANYVVLQGGVNKFNNSGTGNNKAALVTYVEVPAENNKVEVVFDDASVTLTGLVVRDGQKINIAEDKAVVVTGATCLKGLLSLGGSLNYNTWAGYFSYANDDDRKNVVTYGMTSAVNP